MKIDHFPIYNHTPLWDRVVKYAIIDHNTHSHKINEFYSFLQKSKTILFLCYIFSRLLSYSLDKTNKKIHTRWNHAGLGEKCKYTDIINTYFFLILICYRHTYVICQCAFMYNSSWIFRKCKYVFSIQSTNIKVNKLLTIYFSLPIVSIFWFIML